MYYNKKINIFLMKKNTEKNKYKLCAIMTTGRTGSDYLNGCLDNVKNLMVFSGKFDYQIFFSSNKHLIDKEIIIFKFLKKYRHLLKENKIENLKLNIKIQNFRKIFLNISPPKMNRKTFLIKLFETYHLTLNRKLNNLNTIIYHTHNKDLTKKFLNDFPNSKILATIRDPRANLMSGLKNWFHYDHRRIHMEHIWIYLRRIRDDLKFLNSIKNKKFFVKLENMEKISYKSKILKFLKKLIRSYFLSLKY